MKIAVASDENRVAGHFGHCGQFWIFETKNGSVINEEAIANPGHKPGFLPNFLNEMGVNVIISGGMGGGAIDIFNQKDIEVIVGATGLSKMAATSYLSGELKSTGSVCHAHEHADSCHA